MKVAYIAHPIAGDVDRNVNLILSICKSINLTEHDTIPFAPYIVDVMAMEDSIPEQRKRGMKNNATLFAKGFIDELRLYGPKISPGMQEEIKLAKKYGIPVISMEIERHLEFFKLKTHEN